jgi:hypothetical protein
LIYGDLLILASQTQEAGVVAYKKLTGDVQWVSEPFPGAEGYVSPTVVKIDGEDQIVMVSSSKPRRGGTGGERHPPGGRPGSDGRPPDPSGEGSNKIEDQATETEMDVRPEATGLQMESHLLSLGLQ